LCHRGLCRINCDSCTLRSCFQCACLRVRRKALLPVLVAALMRAAGMEAISPGRSPCRPWLAGSSWSASMRNGICMTAIGRWEALVSICMNGPRTATLRHIMQVQQASPQPPWKVCKAAACAGSQLHLACIPPALTSVVCGRQPIRSLATLRLLATPCGPACCVQWLWIPALLLIVLGRMLRAVAVDTCAPPDRARAHAVPGAGCRCAPWAGETCELFSQALILKEVLCSLFPK